jgi:hypothetical protein
MGRSKEEQYAAYRPMPYNSRFWLYSESCYTEEDLALRDWVLRERTNSGIDREYLVNPSSWFADDSQALINSYENSWVYSTAYRTRQVLSQDDFYVQPVNSQRLQSQPIYNLMQNVGDYLLLRNQNLPQAHLNQPMNFVFLDINNILRGLSQNPNISQVKEQLEILNRYIRTVEKNISPTVGSDRLFLANFRRVIETKIEPQLTHLLETQLLKERLTELAKTVKKLSIERNRVLHFALNINPVNAHSYDFSTPQIADSASHPTQAAKNCGTSNKEITAELNSILRLTTEQLKNCQNFNLISMNDEILGHYASAISDLNELDRFQNVISEVINLLSQAGEVYTVYQFKEQMVSLLKQITGFIDESSQHIEAIVDANTVAYYKAIQAQQDLSIWQKWLTSEQMKLKTFIKNQDTLAQFPSTSTDLLKTNKALKDHVNEVISHLSQPKTKTIGFNELAGQALQLDRLMGSMHQWIKIQYDIKGIEAPKPPESLRQLPRLKQAPTSRTATATVSYMPKEHNSFFSLKPALLIDCSPHNSDCQLSSVKTEDRQNALGYIGLIVLIPVGILFLYLLLKRKNKQEEPEPIIKGSQPAFDVLRTKFEDILTIIVGIERARKSDFSDGYDDLLNSFRTLKIQAQNGHYDVKAMQEIFDDLEYYYTENFGKAPTLAS